VEALFRRLLHSGRFAGFPRNPEHLDTVLAVAAGGLIRRRSYAEQEVNEVLTEWLGSVGAGLDHVTLRRRMVDCGFLKRATDGSRYFLNYPKVAGVLGDPPFEVDAGTILDDIAYEREARRWVHGGTEHRHGP